MKMENIKPNDNITVDVVEHDGKTYDLLYLQEPRNGSRGELTIVVVFLDSAIPVIGVAERGPSDRYNYELGRKVAFGRLKKKLKEIKVSVAKSG